MLGEDDDYGLKAMVKENLKLAKENNRLLRKMRRAAIYGNILRIIWWALIIGLPIYLYFTFLDPYLVELSKTYENLRGGVENVQNIGEQLPDISGLLDRLPKFGGGE